MSEHTEARDLNARHGCPQWQGSDALVRQGEDGAKVWAWLVEKSEWVSLQTDVCLCLRGMHDTGYEVLTVSHPTPQTCLMTFRLRDERP